jgi:hypothetical protein
MYHVSYKSGLIRKSTSEANVQIDVLSVVHSGGHDTAHYIAHALCSEVLCL